MADSIGQAYVQILPTTKGFSNKLSAELGGGGGGLVSAGKSMGGKLIAGLAAAGIGAAVGKFVSKSISEGKELEQNLGGTEAVFGKFADDLQKKSAEAYKNMGMSASNYMATANKMGSLFQGSGVSQQKSLQMTTDAMQRAADVASVMGIDTQTAMDSIAGAAKGNFTMMDNLGVAMNATTLEAYALEKGMNFDWKTASNAEKSELAMKMFMDRTSQYQNNFAKESEKTLSGSLGAMKSLTQDLMGNLAVGADITPQISALLETAQNFLIGNLLPMISNVVTGVANNAGQLADVLSALITSIGQEIIKVAPNLLQAGITIVVQLGESLIKGIPKLMPMVATLIKDLALMLTEPSNLEALIMTGLDLIVALAEGFEEAAPVLISVIPGLVINLINTFIKLAPKLAPVAIKLIGTLASALIGQTTALLKAGAILLNKLKEKFSSFTEKFKNIGKDIIGGIMKGLEETKQKLIAKLEELAKYLPKSVQKLLGIGSPSKVFADKVGKWIPEGVALGITKNSGVVDEAMEGMFRNPMLTSGGMSMNITARDNTSSYSGLLEAVRQGASEARPIVVLNNRVLSRELKGMGVSFD